MRQAPFQKRLALRFTRWSRKSYAVFCSLGRCVTIGRVSKSITEVSLTKQRGVLNELFNLLKNTWAASSILTEEDTEHFEAQELLMAPLLVTSARTLQSEATRLFFSIDKNRD